jgi:DnaJ-domain-containing protein 1
MLRLLTVLALLAAAIWLIRRLLTSARPGTPAGAPIAPNSRAEALAILGLHEGASPEEIVAAHRQLMQKLHPDRGGNDFLAAQINRAKEILLG